MSTGHINSTCWIQEKTGDLKQEEWPGTRHVLTIGLSCFNFYSKFRKFKNALVKNFQNYKVNVKVDYEVTQQKHMV